MAAAEERTACLACLYDQNQAAPFDADGECGHCGGDMKPQSTLIEDEYFKCALRSAIYKEILRKRSNAYVAHSIVTATVDNVPLPFMERFMGEVAEKGRREKAKPWDKEGPRILSKDFRDSKAWFLTTWGATAFLASFEELDAVIGEEEVAFGPMRQLKKGDCYFLLPPCEVKWDSKQVSEDVELTKVTITACTGNVACHAATTLHVSPAHPHDVNNIKRWTHLPFYSNWQLYVRYKCKFYLRRNMKYLLCQAILTKAISEPTWEACTPPTLVASRVPEEDFKVTRRGYLPYQNPKLTSDASGVATLKEHLEKEEKIQKRAAIEDAAEAAFIEAYQEWEREGYRRGKEITMRTCGTKERQDANLARFGYKKEDNPRFNGLHDQAGYDGVGPDPCDPNNRRSWLLNAACGKCPVRGKVPRRGAY